MPTKIDPYEARKKIKELAPAVAEGLRAAAACALNEAELRAEVSKVLANAAEVLGISLQLHLEYSVAQGRIDALYNRFVVEYEAPGNLTERPSTKNDESIKQVKRYINELAPAEKRARHRYAGVSTDGRFFIFVRFMDGKWQPADRPLEVSPRTVEILLHYLATLTVEKPLTAENLVRDFGAETDVAKGFVGAFYYLITQPADDRAAVIFNQWSENFSEACDYEAGVAHAKKTALQKAAALFGLDVKTPVPFPLYYSIHTYFALLVKLLAAQLVSIYRYKKAGNIAREMVGLAGPALREKLADVESGGYFERLGIKNFLEADFFSWYLDRWNGGLAEKVSSLAGELYRYDFPGTETQPGEYRDILQSVYQDLMPRELRHNLGEYYTPGWLVERILNQLGYGGDPRVRILDPACGSGTFLFHEIRRLRNIGRRDLTDEAYLLDAALNNVVGFDLNPVAVTTARTSYLLALGELLDAYTGEVNIPVYTADSIMTPFAGTDLQRADAHVVDTTVGQFTLPKNLGGLADVGRLMDLAALHVRNRLEPASFAVKARDAFPALTDKDVDLIRGTYERLLALDAAGKNGIWCAIVKNAFAPVFAQPFDFIAGNPPWINWESLPDGYRDSTKKVWIDYGLFPHSGMDTILGKGKKDISTLMTYVAMDKYLKKGGKLGFVITQSVFKTGGAGQGFRRFRLGDGARVKVKAVDDMVLLKPFPGVGNRTAIMILEKGRENKYPVKYNYWKKKAKASLKPEMTLPEVVALTTHVQFDAQPVNRDDNTSAWMTGRPKALTAAAKVLGKSEYEAHAGVYTGGANAVYWVEILEERPDGLLVIKNITEGAKRKVPDVEAVIEPDLVYPLLRGRDVKRWRAEPSAHIIMVQDPVKRRGIDEAETKDRWPRTYAYLKQFEKALRERKSQSIRNLMEKGSFYSMFAVGDYTFAPFKVGWREVASKIDASVFSSSKGNLVIPDHKIIIIPAEEADEAFYMSSIINSEPFRFTAESYITISPDPHIVENVRIIPYKKTSADCKALTSLSKTAHEFAAAGEEAKLADVEAEIDERVAHLYGITTAELKEIKKSLEELTG